jgi:hypothetical protein
LNVGVILVQIWCIILCGDTHDLHNMRKALLWRSFLLYYPVGATIGRPIVFLRTCNARPYDDARFDLQKIVTLFTFVKTYVII